MTALVRKKQLSEADATEWHMSTLTMIKKDRSDHFICMTQWSNEKMSTFNDEQHHRIAIMRVNHKNKKLNKNVKSKKEKRSLSEIKDQISCILVLIWIKKLIIMISLKNYLWTINFYDVKKLKMNAFFKLWINEYDVYQSNSDELMYLQMIQILYDSKQSHNMMSEKLCYWLK